MKIIIKKIIILTAFSLLICLVIFAIFSSKKSIPDYNKINWYSMSTWESFSGLLSSDTNLNKLKSKDWELNIMFFWDLMYDRWVYMKLSWDNDLRHHFLYRFKKPVKFWNTDTNFYRLAKNFDFVWLNLETPIWKYIIKREEWKKPIKKKICAPSSKIYAFCSYVDILPMLKKLWFNMVNLANNHVMDWWVKTHQETVKLLDQYWIKYFWYIRHWKYFEKNYIYTWEKNWILFARHGYDYTINNFLGNKYCASLQEYKKDWYTNFVSVHRWVEYAKTHSLTQESIAKFLIDCGADMIVWHHPHVIQDTWWYSGKTIIYSLWNFLFDQYFSEPTKIGWYALINYDSQKNKTSLSTGIIDAYAD